MKKISTLLRKSEGELILAGGIVSIVIGYVDYATTPAITFSIFYLIPIFVVAWFGGKRAGVSVAAISSLMWMFVEMRFGMYSGHAAIAVWNFVARFGVFCLVVVLLTRLRDLQSRLEHTVEERTAALTAEIEEREHTEEILSQSKQNLETLFENAFDAFLLFDNSGSFIQTNAAATKLLGYSSADFKRLKTSEIIAGYQPSARNDSGLLDPNALQGEIAVRRRDGTLIETEYRSVPDILPGIHLTALEDISVRKAAESALRANEKRLRALFENNWDLVCMADREGTITYVTPSVYRTFGYSESDLVGHKVFEFIHDDDRAQLETLLNEILAAPHTNAKDQLRVREKNGSWLWIDVIGTNVLDDPDLGSVIFNGRDVTERRTANEELKRSHEQLTLVLESLPIVVYVSRSGPEPDILYISSNVVNVTGYRAQDFISNASLRNAQIHPDDLPSVLKNLDTLQRNGFFETEYRWRHADGTYRWFYDSCRLFISADRKSDYIAGVWQDITQRKAAEEELKSSREHLRVLSTKLESIREEEKSRIAIEIHDEFGQVLTALKMDLAYIVRNLARAGESQHEHTIAKLNTMSKIIDSTVEKVRQIATDLRPDVLDDVGLLGAVSIFAQEFQARTGIICKTSLPAEQFPIPPDRSTAVFRVVQESLTNVVRHAHATTVEIQLVYDDNKVLLEIRDDGQGISDAQVAGKKSIGLVGMRERARLFGGTFSIQGVPGKGTVLRVAIPLQ